MDGLRDTLRRTGGIHAVADRLDQPFPDVDRIADIALPLLASALHAGARRQGGGEKGCRAILAQLQQFGGGEMAVAVMSPGETSIRPGEALLDAVLPRVGARSAIVNAVARKAGVGVWQVAAALPVLAMLIGGYVAARSLEDPAVCQLEDLLEPGDDAAVQAVYDDAGLAP